MSRAERADPSSRARPARLAVALLAVSIGLLVVAAGVGPSAIEPRLPGAGMLPPYSFGYGKASPGLVVGLVVSALILGALGLWRALHALATGWCPRPRALVGAGLLATVLLLLVPPMGSADPESYAAYGRIAATGHDPYSVTPHDRALVGDPVAAAVETPWQEAPSVYGPVATAEQELASQAGGRSLRTTVVTLALLNAVAFVGTGLILRGAARTPAGRRRAAVLWLVNPLLLFELVSGVHVDALVALGVVAAAAILLRTRGLAAAVVAGVCIGLAAGVKLPALLVLVAAVWALRGELRRAAAVVLGAVVTLAVSYAFVGWEAVVRTTQASKLASWATPWRPLISLFDHTVHQPGSRTLMRWIALLVLIALIAVLIRAARAKALDRDVATLGFIGMLAFVLAAPYSLPWYDAPVWGLLALVAAWPTGGPYDDALVLRTGALSLAYVTRAAVPLGGATHGVVTVLRNGVAPVLLAVALVAIVVRAWTDGNQQAVTPQERLPQGLAPADATGAR